MSFRHVFLFLAIISAIGAAAPSGYAELKVRGKDKDKVLVPGQFKGDQKKAYDLFAKRCTKCHEMARPVSALETGKTPISGSVFNDSGIKKYVVKMMRKPNSGITRDDARDIIVFLRHARSLAEDRK
jgi:hypothetical protein